MLYADRASFMMTPFPPCAGILVSEALTRSMSRVASCSHLPCTEGDFLEHRNFSVTEESVLRKEERERGNTVE